MHRMPDWNQACLPLRLPNQLPQEAQQHRMRIDVSPISSAHENKD
jgi:hypothetical protein